MRRVAVDLAVPAVQVQAGLHDVIGVGGGGLGQVDERRVIALDEVRELADLDVGEVGQTLAGVHGEQQLVVHVLVRVHGEIEVDGLVGVLLVPLLGHFFVDLAVELGEHPHVQRGGATFATAVRLATARAAGQSSGCQPCRDRRGQNPSVSHGDTPDCVGYCG